jgi:hypothetical protein
MLQVFHLDVASVSYACISVSGVSYACCRCFIWMLQVFYLNVAKVYRGCSMCCGGYTRILQAYVLSVSTILDGYCNCFIWMLQSRSGCSMFYNGFTCILQIYVSNVLFVFKHMLQVFFSRASFTSPPNPKYFLLHTSHQIFRRMHEALNVGKKDN